MVRLVSIWVKRSYFMIFQEDCKDVQDTFNLSQTTCGRILSRMKEEGQISQHGKGKNTFYILKEKK